MNKIVLTSLLYLIISTLAFSQKKTAEFKNGSKFEYEFIDKNPDNMSRINISWLNGLNFNYFQPRRYILNANVHFWKAGVDGLIFIASHEKEKTRSFVIKSEGSRYDMTKYVIKEDIPRITSLGFHTGYYRLYNYLWTANANEAFAGLGISVAQRCKYIVNYGNRPIKKNNNFRISLYADALFFWDGTVVDAAKNPDVKIAKIGYRVYLETKESLGTDYEWGYLWKLGFQEGPVAGSNTELIGFGLYFSVGK
jgi:hypothetical protein